MEVYDDPIFKEFVDSKNIRPTTIHNYALRLQKYTNYLDMTLSEIIDEAEQEEDTRIRMRMRKIKKYLIGFRDYLELEGMTFQTVKSYMSAVRNFYRTFEIEIPYISNNKQTKMKHVRNTLNDLPSLREIETIISRAKPKYKAMITLAMSSGMGGAEVRSLKVSDYLKAHDVEFDENTDIKEILSKIDENNVPTWHITRIKMDRPYFTFSTPECNKLINDYLSTRKDLKPDDWLFDGRLVKKGKPIGDKSVPVRKETLIMTCTRLNRVCDLCNCGKFKDTNENYFHFHILRKFFASTIRSKGMDKSDADYLLGHKSNDIADIYIKEDVERLKREYLSIMNFVSISDVKPRVIEIGSEELQRLRQLEKRLEATEESNKKSREKFKELFGNESSDKRNLYSKLEELLKVYSSI